jgi:hypothetical protein
MRAIGVQQLEFMLPSAGYLKLLSPKPTMTAIRTAGAIVIHNPALNYTPG